jgi:hypothetical protein
LRAGNVTHVAVYSATNGDFPDDTIARATRDVHDPRERDAILNRDLKLPGGVQ